MEEKISDSGSINKRVVTLDLSLLNLTVNVDMLQQTKEFYLKINRIVTKFSTIHCVSYLNAWRAFLRNVNGHFLIISSSV
ncbi:hypothetical protein RIR_jg40507.t1 [Rhizophagus irregularis DAOM 181602=DAOM 197198]|nr:hypothetical protein RIR_jg40507.t1 [Rhizophagus irregularis DAOM 181602=DAOM 197198]